MKEENKLQLSFDIDAQWQKIARFSFPSYQHYIVELVRSALRRKASRVEVICKKDYLQVTDDGAGIDPEIISAITIAKNCALDESRREMAVLYLKQHQISEAFALFSGNPQKVIIENYHQREKQILTIEEKEVRAENRDRTETGTKIIIHRTDANYKEQIKLLADYCRQVSQKIVVNGRELEKKPFFGLLLACERVKISQPAGTILIGIPQEGEHCTFWLTDQLMPHKILIKPAVNGLVFNALLEAKELSEQILSEIIPFVKKLYEKLAARFVLSPAPQKTRLQELFLKYYREAESKEHPASLLQFQEIVANSCITLKNLIEKELIGSAIYFIPENEPTRFYNCENKTVLRLSPQESDFLINDLQINLIRLPRIKSGLIMKNKFLRMKKEILFFLLKRLRRLFEEVEETELTAGEKKLAENLLLFFSERSIGDRQRDTALKINVLFLQRAPLAGLIIREQSQLNIYLNRKHRLVQKTIKNIKTSPETTEIFASYLSYHSF